MPDPAPTNYTPEQQALLDQFTKGLDADSAAAIVRRVSDLETENAALKGEPDLSADLAAATKRAEDAEAALAEANARAEQAENAKADLETENAALQLEAPAKPRSLGAPGKSVKTLSGDDLRKAIAAADDVEIAFSDGTREIAGLAPFAITGDPWREHPAGLMLTQPVTLNGPANGAAPITVAGVVLLLDDKPVAYQPREGLTVAPGASVRLADDIIFA